jgi:hypothetical protein
MIRSIQREKLLDTLLNTLEAERYVRGPLLLEVLDALDAAERPSPAATQARRMLAGVESGRLRDTDFVAELAELRQLAQSDSRASAA